MKRIFLIGVLLSGAIFASAQCIEVKGVESRLVQYEVNANGGEYGYYGFEYKNLNDYTVTIEAELWLEGNNSRNKELDDTKSFVLKAGERYVWKNKIYYNNEFGITDYRSYYFTKFKTFKCP
jgi:hypothetical protein